MNTSSARQTLDTWGRVADDYDAMFVPFSSAVALAALDELGLRPGMRLLDVATGTGALALQAASAGAQVTAIDSSDTMLEVLRAKLEVDGAIVTRVMDGQVLDLEDETFDGSASNLGIVLFPEPVKALREMCRVLRVGARAVVSSISRPAESPLMQTIFRALDETGLEPPVDGATSLQPLAEKDRLAAALDEAGFGAIRVETVTVPWVVQDAKEFWSRWGTVAPPVAPFFRLLPKDRLDVAGDVFARLVREMHGPGPASFPSEVLLGLGSRLES